MFKISPPWLVTQLSRRGLACFSDGAEKVIICTVCVLGLLMEDLETKCMEHENLFMSMSLFLKVVLTLCIIPDLGY